MYCSSDAFDCKTVTKDIAVTETKKVPSVGAGSVDVTACVEKAEVSSLVAASTFAVNRGCAVQRCGLGHLLATPRARQTFKAISSAAAMIAKTRRVL